MADPHCVQGPERHVVIGTRGDSQQTDIGRAPHEHHLNDRKRKAQVGRLWYIGHLPCQLPGCERAHVPPGDRDAAALHALRPQEAAQQRRLAHAVGAKQTEDLTLAHCKSYVVQERGTAWIAKDDSLDTQNHPCRPLVSRRMKTGAPSKAVRMPRGMSIRATVRHTSSTRSK